MEMIMTALALVASSQAASSQPPAQPAEHAQHQSGQKHDGEGCCCCKDMAESKKMACCEKHEKADTGGHAGHSSH